MWVLVGIGCLVACVFVLLLWDYGLGDAGQQNHEGGSANSRLVGDMSPAANGSGHTIAYTMTRWDVAASWLILGSRNRMVQILLLLGLLIIESMVLGDVRPDSFATLATTVLVVFLAFVIPIVLAVFLIALLMAFLFKRPEVIGQHTLSITKRGLLESNDLTETLLKWRAIRHVRSTRRYLFVSATEFHAQVVPKRHVGDDQLKQFEAEVLVRIKGAAASAESEMKDEMVFDRDRQPARLSE